MVPHDSGGNTVAARGMVTVVGDAVIDHIYRTEQMPAAGSWARGHFDIHVGGKGLNRAVAAARLGLRVQLVTVVGDDDGGRRILEYLDGENVDTGLVTIVPDPTPIVAVVVAENGDSAAIGRLAGTELVRQDRLRDVLTPAASRAITASDLVLLTFGLPAAVIDAVLSTIRATPDRPRLLVHPAPPIETAGELRNLRGYFDAIDYLIGTPWQLDGLMVDAPESGDADIARRVFTTLGARCVCAVEHFACSVRSDAIHLDIPAGPSVDLDDSPGAGAAFTGALAYRLVTTGQPAGRADFEWAAAAMAAAQSCSAFPDAMPTVEEIDRIVAATR